MSENGNVSNESGLVKVDATLAPSLVRPIAPAELIAAHKEWVEVIQAVLEPDRDYGIIPGTGGKNPKPTLLKPGAERLALAARFSIAYEVVEKECDHDREFLWSKTRWRKDGSTYVLEGTSKGLYRYVVRCRLLHRGSERLAGEGLASASTMESKFIDRPRDCENTVLKMAEKRALVAAILNTLALSDRFTQDLEDIPPMAPPPPTRPAGTPGPQNGNAQRVVVDVEPEQEMGSDPDPDGTGDLPDNYQGDTDTDVRMVTPNQVRLIWAKLHGAFDHGQVKQAEAKIKRAFVVDSLDKLPAQQVDAVLRWIVQQQGK